MFSAIWENVIKCPSHIWWLDLGHGKCPQDFGDHFWAAENVYGISGTFRGPQKTSSGTFKMSEKCLVGNSKCQKNVFVLSGTWANVNHHMLVAGPATRPRNVLCNPAANVPRTPPSLTSISKLQVSAFGFPELVSQSEFDILGAILASRNTLGNDFGTSGASWEAILAARVHLGRPFWHLGTTLEDHERSRMDTNLRMTGFLSILE